MTTSVSDLSALIKIISIDNHSMLCPKFTMVSRLAEELLVFVKNAASKVSTGALFSYPILLGSLPLGIELCKSVNLD